ncbi:MAG: LLM class flavin-dependent oxidoreductase [Chloroflexi bacterium]|nr:LLM class flavin-dependent oxidoreductase [Chloroflexota bacterium]
MKFGLFYEMQLPRPLDAESWDPDAERRLFGEMIEQVELADRLGYDYVFFVEHHFLEEYAHSSAPEMVLAALSGRTSRIRLGHGVIQMPPSMNHPARVAERIATLDVLSGGRVEFGTGEGTSDTELNAFHVGRAVKKSMWEEATRECVKMMVQTPYEGYEGEFFSMGRRNVIPKPLQRPHPPLWVAASRRETTMLAARFGIGSLGFGFETPEETAERVQEYYRLVREECFPIGVAINPGLLVLNQFMCAEDDEEAVRRSANGPGFFSYSLGYYSTSGGTARDEQGVSLIERHQPGRTNIFRNFSALPQEQKDGRRQLQQARLLTQEEIAAQEPEGETARALFRAARSGSAIGSPDTIRRNIARYEDAHLDVMVLNAQCGDRRHEHIMEAIELFGTQVMPDFQERHETKHRRWREGQLAGVELPVNSSI